MDDPLLSDQMRYYRTVAPRYEKYAIPGAWGGELAQALSRFCPRGKVLELACGPGTWTAQLIRYATAITAVDGSPEMLARARERVGGDERIRFVQANIFEWVPDGRYDAVFFGFWLSHVPPERFEQFWSLVDSALRPDGRVMFVDDTHRGAEELIYGESSTTVRRTLEDGNSFDVVKVPWQPAALQQRLRGLGWAITVTQASDPFYWGTGTRQ